MNDEMKKAIERLREGDYVRRYGQIVALIKERQDILAVCDCAEKAMRVVEAAKGVLDDAQGGLTGKCWRVGKPAMNQLSEALAAMEEP
jgi:hypothetical protein